MKAGKLITGMNAEVRSCLSEYDWPGNVRELVNVIEGAVCPASQPLITWKDIPPHFAEHIEAGAGSTKNSSRNERELPDDPVFPLHVMGTVPGKLEELERAAIEEALTGTNGNKRRAANRLSGESCRLTAIAATEPSAGSDILSMRTRAVRKGDKYILNGQECFITNGSVADFFVVYAFTDPSKKARGISAFVAEKGFTGLVYGKNENKMGMRGSINSELFFEDMEVPAENLVGEEGSGFVNLMKTLAKSRLFCASQAVGIA